MATKAQATKAAKADEIRIPKKLPAIKGMTAKQVENLYRSERTGINGQKGLGHVRVMARLSRRAKGETVPALNTLRRYTEPVTA
jgi:hypothetical protein